MKKYGFFIAALIVFVVLNSCTTLSPIVDHDVRSRVVDCIPGLVNPPIPISPLNTTITETEPIRFAWSYDPTPGCGVDGFTLEIREDFLAMGGLASWILPAGIRSVEVDPSFLADCHKYYWIISATGSGETTLSDPAIFYTNFLSTCPAWVSCATTGLAFRYSNFYPWNMYTINTLNPPMLWDMYEPYCAVNDYHLEVSTTPFFTDAILSRDTTEQAFLSEENFLEDCQLYFWRIVARSGEMEQQSNILHFETDLGYRPGMGKACPRTMCSTAYIPDVIRLVSPAEDATVNTLHPQLLWYYDYSACIPSDIQITISESPTLVPVAFTMTDSWGDHFIDYTSYISFLEDCKTYYWQLKASTELAVLPGELPYAEVLSPIGMFHTDVRGTCSTSGGTGKAIFKGLSLGCITLDTQFAFLDFDGPIQGDFEVRIKNKTWPCYSESNTPNRLICSGKAVEAGIMAYVELWDKTGNELVLKEQVTTPNCQEEIKPTACQTPDKPCNPQFNCAFDTTSCRCEKPDHSPCP